MKCKLPFILFFLATHLLAKAQYDNVWAFGDSAGIDFSGGIPQPIKTSIKSVEGCASICNSKGQLLFYTDGTDVWNRNHKLMPNGKNLLGPRYNGHNITYSTAQGALIMPIPGNTDQYYIFSLGCAESSIYQNSYGKLFYSIVDMNLNTGLGDVISSDRGVLFDSLLTEEMTAVSGNDCNLWLLVASRTESVMKAYKIEFNGINMTPVISPAALPNGEASPYSMAAATNRRKIAIGSRRALYDFDPDSGIASNPIVLPETYIYSLCFSPDNSKIYLTTCHASPRCYRLAQYDLSSNDSTVIVNSRQIIGGDYYTFTLRRGPDDKIYYAAGKYERSQGEPNGFLGVINHPNLSGAACLNQDSGFLLFPGTFARYGLPNASTIITNEKISNSTIDTMKCLANQHFLKASNLSGQDYVWEDSSSGATRTVTQSGTYWLSYRTKTLHCYDDYIDTFIVVSADKHITTSKGIIGKCKYDTILLKANLSIGSNYQWNNEYLGVQQKIHNDGIYWVSYQVDSLCEYHIDSFIVDYPQKDDEVSFESDTLVCAHNPISFQNTSPPSFNKFSWYFNENDSSSARNLEIAFSNAGIYKVLLIGLINSSCIDTFSQIIIVDDLLSASFHHQPNSICKGEIITFSHFLMGPTLSKLTWDWGDLHQLSGSLESVVHHAYDQTGTLTVTLTARFRTCPESTFTDTVYVYGLPQISLPPDSSICLRSSAMVLRNLSNNSGQTTKYLWNTGATTENIQVLHPGTYSLTVTQEPLGCSSTESIEITRKCYIDIPNAFSPNNDGINDYFFPRQYNSKGLQQFKLKIFNMWGQLLFETINTEGRGWDGRFQGLAQPAGVYVYHVEAMFEDNHSEIYEGNVTLIR